MSSRLGRRVGVALVALPLLGACGSSAEPASTGNTSTGGNAVGGMTGGAAGSATSTGGNSGTATAGNANSGSGGAAAGASNVGGNANPGGSGGATGGGDAGGAAGAAGVGGAGGTSAPSTMGMQADPGIEGDGTFDQPPPYDLQPESMGPIDGAPQGQLIGPTLYTQTGSYEGWDMWVFPYWVYVPAQYQPGHAAAIMIFNDGAKYIGDQTQSAFTFNTPTVFNNLIHEGSMPVTIGVFIGPGSNDGHFVTGGDGGRAQQYDTPNDQYGKFIFEEFIPSEIIPTYDIVTDADGWAMGGHSSGGIASIMAAWFYPDRLHKVLTASPSFPNTGGVFPNEFNSVTPAKPLRIYHMAGTQDLGGFKDANDSAAEIFAELGYHYRYRPGEDTHAPPSAAAADFPDALRWLWRGYTAGL